MCAGVFNAMKLMGLDGRLYEVDEKVHLKIVRRARSAMIPYCRALTQLGITFLVIGCVQKHAHISAPSTAAVQGGINNAQLSNTAAQRHNDVARGIAGRIDAKAGVIEKYFPQ